MISTCRKCWYCLSFTKTQDIKAEKTGRNKKIITFNNSQTVIKDSDFRSNDDIQNFLQRKIEEHYYCGVQPIKRLKYVPKRVHAHKGKDHLVVTMELLARILYAFDYDPVLISKGTKALFDIIDASRYYEVFGVAGPETLYFDDKRFKKVIALSISWTRLHELISTNQKGIEN